MSSTVTTTELRKQFFRHLWGRREGFLTIASLTEADRVDRNSKGWRERAFHWPDEEHAMLTHIDMEEHGRHVWFTPLLYDTPHRGKDDVSVANIVWADLDACDPATVEPSPPIVLESSPGRYQAIWRLDVEQPIPAMVCGDYSRRIAYKYRDMGADVSGSDLAQLLRVPGSFNYKSEYSDTDGNPPRVGIANYKNVYVPVAIFEALPKVDKPEYEYEEMPTALDANGVIEKHKQRLSNSWYMLFQNIPGDDWSRHLWRLHQSSFEAGMNKQEVFSVALEAGCNKFDRDGHNANLRLWGDVLRAFTSHDNLRRKLQRFAPAKFTLPTFYSPVELPQHETFVERYVEWARTRTDAPSQYHELSAFIVLSSLLAGNININIMFADKFRPNIWGMILADTTMTRKTTAMDLGVDLLHALPGMNEIILATDGTSEGIFRALSRRPGKPSLFLRDEFQGLVSSVQKKDYMVDMVSNLTKLYDCRGLKRTLAKETITVTDPIFILYGGGIKSDMFDSLGQEHVKSGFLPRFFVVMAETDQTQLKRNSRRTDISDTQRAKLVNELTTLKNTYVDPQIVSIGNQATEMVPSIEALPTDGAYDKLNEIEDMYLDAVEKLEDEVKNLYLPTLDRFGKSTLKAATLLSATRQEPKDDKIEVTKDDFVKALSYTTQWLPHSLTLIDNVGMSASEKLISRVMEYVKGHEGTRRADIMMQFRLSQKQMDEVQGTIEGRGLVSITKQGKGHYFFTIE